MSTHKRPVLSPSLALSFVLPLALLTACPPPGGHVPPDPRPDIALASGAWRFEVVDAELVGRCDGASPRDIIGQQLVAQLSVRGDGRARMVLEGLTLQGGFRGQVLEVAGFMDDRGGVTPMPDTDTGVSSGDVDAPPSDFGVPDEPAAAHGPSADADVYLIAWAADSHHLDGSLQVSEPHGGAGAGTEAGSEPGGDAGSDAGHGCQIDADIEGVWLGSGGGQPDFVGAVSQGQDGTETGCDADVDCG